MCEPITRPGKGTGNTLCLHALAISPDGFTVAVGSAEGMVYVRDLKRGDEVGRFRVGPGSVRALAFSADGEAVLAGANSLELVRCDLRDGRQEVVRRVGGGGMVSVAFSAGGRRAVVSPEDEDGIWVVGLGGERVGRAFGVAARCMALSPEGKVFVAGVGAEVVVGRLWE